jgi:hypothetical protein
VGPWAAPPNRSIGRAGLLRTLATLNQQLLQAAATFPAAAVALNTTGSQNAAVTAMANQSQAIGRLLVLSPQDNRTVASRQSYEYYADLEDVSGQLYTFVQGGGVVSPVGLAMQPEIASSW